MGFIYGFQTIVHSLISTKSPFLEYSDVTSYRIYLHRDNVRQIIFCNNSFVLFGSSGNNDGNSTNLTVPQNNSHKNSADGQTDIPEKLKAAKQDEQTSLEAKSPRIQFI